MKEIKKAELKKVIKKEYKEAYQWCKSGYGHTYQMMIDTENAEIWTDLFLDCNSWIKYHSNTISSLNGLGWLATISEIEEAYLADAIAKLNEAGWEIID